MRKLFRYNDVDENAYKIDKLQQEIIELNSKEYLSEWEFQTLEMKKAELIHLRNM